MLWPYLLLSMPFQDPFFVDARQPESQQLLVYIEASEGLLMFQSHYRDPFQVTMVQHTWIGLFSSRTIGLVLQATR